MACETVTIAKMTELDELRRDLPAESRLSLWRAPDGWQHRRFDWPHAAPHGRVLVQGGRADIIEKFIETFRHLHEHGWSVTAFDWRGQGGSGRLAADRHVGHATSFAPWVADLSAFWQGWRSEEAGPAVLLGHSMGAHLALRAMLDGGVDADAAVLVAPMIGIRSPLGSRIGGFVAAAAARFGGPARPVWKTRPGDATSGHRQQRLTHSLARYGDEAYWYGRDPDLLLGPPSWAWVREAFVSGASLLADPRLSRLAVPTLMLVAEQDQLVDSRAALRLAARLPDVELVRFGAEAAHEILREEDAVRLRACRAITDFLARRL